MELPKFSKKKVESILTRLSLFKQNEYCNVAKLVYRIGTRSGPSILPKIDLNLDILSEKSQIYRYSSDENLKPDIEKLRYFLEHGCTVHILLHRNQAVGRYVICDPAKFKPYLYLNHSIFCKCANYIFFCRTYDPYKRMNVYKFSLNKISQDGLKGNKQIFISCDIDNIASKSGIVGAGFRKIGALRYVSLFGIEIYSKLSPDEGPYDH